MLTWATSYTIYLIIFFKEIDYQTDKITYIFLFDIVPPNKNIKHIFEKILVVKK